MKFNCTEIQKFISPKDSSLIGVYCVRTQGESHLQKGLGSLWGCTSALLSPGSLRGWELGMQNACGLLKAHLLEINSGRSHSQGTTARFFKWNPAVLKGQWWKMMSLVYPFLGHRFFLCSMDGFPCSAGWHISRGACFPSLSFCPFKHWEVLEEMLK